MSDSSRTKARRQAANLALRELLDGTAVVAVLAGKPDIAAELLEMLRRVREEPSA